MKLDPVERCGENITPVQCHLVPEVYSAATSTLLESRRQGWRERDRQMAEDG